MRSLKYSSAVALGALAASCAIDAGRYSVREDTEALDGPTDGATTPSRKKEEENPTTNPDGTCRIEGAYGLRISYRLVWDSTAFVNAGNGQIDLWAKINRTELEGGSFSDAMTWCGATFPDLKTLEAMPVEVPGFEVLAGRTFRPLVPGILFDPAPLLAPARVTGSYQGRVPGSGFTVNTFAILFGTSLPDPARDEFPDEPASTDHDGDGKYGISLIAAEGEIPSAGGEQYSNYYAPDVPPKEVDAIYVTGRQSGSYVAKLNDCDHAEGVLAVPTQADGTYATNITIGGCRHADTGEDCTESQSQGMADVVPIFRPANLDRHGSIEFRRIDSSDTCADVRALLAAVAEE